MAERLRTEELPAPWKYAVTSDGRVFFINDETRTTTWVHPVTGKAVASGYEIREDLPLGWEEDVTPDGQVYFVHHYDESTTFINPVTGRTEMETDTPDAPQMYPPTDPHNSPERSPHPQAPLSPSPQQKPSFKKRTIPKNAAPQVKRRVGAVVSKDGWLLKKDSTGLGVWRKRWCVISDFCLFYYKGSDEVAQAGTIMLPSYVIKPVDPKDKINKKFAFKCEHSNMRTYYFSADSEDLMHQWIGALSDASQVNLDRGYSDRDEMDLGEHRSPRILRRTSSNGFPNGGTDPQSPPQQAPQQATSPPRTSGWGNYETIKMEGSLAGETNPRNGYGPDSSLQHQTSKESWEGSQPRSVHDNGSHASSSGLSPPRSPSVHSSASHDKPRDPPGGYNYVDIADIKERKRQNQLDEASLRSASQSSHPDDQRHGAPHSPYGQDDHSGLRNGQTDAWGQGSNPRPGSNNARRSESRRSNASQRSISEPSHQRGLRPMEEVPITRASTERLHAAPRPSESSYQDRPPQRGREPPMHDRVPPQHGRGPPGYVRGPPEHARSPSDYGRVPPELSRSPSQYSRSLSEYSRSPSEHARSPSDYGRVPLELARSQSDYRGRPPPQQNRGPPHHHPNQGHGRGPPQRARSQQYGRMPPQNRGGPPQQGRTPPQQRRSAPPSQQHGRPPPQQERMQQSRAPQEHGGRPPPMHQGRGPAMQGRAPPHHHQQNSRTPSRASTMSRDPDRMSQGQSRERGMDAVGAGPGRRTPSTSSSSQPVNRNDTLRRQELERDDEVAPLRAPGPKQAGPKTGRYRMWQQKTQQFVDLSTGIRLRLSIAAGDLLGKSHEELVLFLIQLRRDKANLQEWLAMIDNELTLLKDPDSTTPGSTRLRSRHSDSLRRSTSDMNEDDDQEYFREVLQEQEEVARELDISAPLINLVDNLVRMGSLYGGDNHMIAQEFYGDKVDKGLPYAPPKKLIEFSRRLEEEKLVQDLEAELKQLETAEDVELQEKLDQLHELDKKLQEISARVTVLRNEKDKIEGTLEKLDQQITHDWEDQEMVARIEEQQRQLERQLTRVRSELAKGTKELEEITVENGRIEHEVALLKSGMEGMQDISREKSADSVKEKLQMEREVNHVQSVMNSLERQRTSLATQMDTLRRTQAKGDHEQTGAPSLGSPGKVVHRKSSREALLSGPYAVTDLDALKTVDIRALPSMPTSPERAGFPDVDPSDPNASLPAPQGGYLDADRSQGDRSALPLVSPGVYPGQRGGAPPDDPADQYSRNQGGDFDPSTGEYFSAADQPGFADGPARERVQSGYDHGRFDHGQGRYDSDVGGGDVPPQMRYEGNMADDYHRGSMHDGSFEGSDQAHPPYSSIPAFDDVIGPGTVPPVDGSFSADLQGFDHQVPPAPQVIDDPHLVQAEYAPPAFASPGFSPASQEQAPYGREFSPAPHSQEFSPTPQQQASHVREFSPQPQQQHPHGREFSPPPPPHQQQDPRGREFSPPPPQQALKGRGSSKGFMSTDLDTREQYPEMGQAFGLAEEAVPRYDEPITEAVPHPFDREESFENKEPLMAEVQQQPPLTSPEANSDVTPVGLFHYTSLSPQSFESPPQSFDYPPPPDSMLATRPFNDNLAPPSQTVTAPPLDGVGNPSQDGTFFAAPSLEGPIDMAGEPREPEGQEPMQYSHRQWDAYSSRPQWDGAVPFTKHEPTPSELSYRSDDSRRSDRKPSVYGPTPFRKTSTMEPSSKGMATFSSVRVVPRRAGRPGMDEEKKNRRKSATERLLTNQPRSELHRDAFSDTEMDPAPEMVIKPGKSPASRLKRQTSASQRLIRSARAKSLPGNISLPSPSNDPLSPAHRDAHPSHLTSPTTSLPPPERPGDDNDDVFVGPKVLHTLDGPVNYRPSSVWEKALVNDLPMRDVEMALKTKEEEDEEQRKKANFVYKSDLKNVEFDESTGGGLLGIPAKVHIPERYDPTQDEDSETGMETDEERHRRDQRAQKMAKILTSQSLQEWHPREIVPEWNGQDQPPDDMKHRVEREKELRQEVLAKRRALAHEVSQQTKVLAAQMNAVA